MERRNFLVKAVVMAAAASLSGTAMAAERYFPTKVDPALFTGVNRVKDPAQKSPLEKSHGPVIKAPAKVKAGEPFTVEVSVGEVLHPMGPAHWIEYIELYIGNEPAGRVSFQSRGYLKPRAVFTAVLMEDAASGGMVTLVATQHCNLHGLWEGSLDIALT